RALFACCHGSGQRPSSLHAIVFGEAPRACCTGDALGAQGREESGHIPLRRVLRRVSSPSRLMTDVMTIGRYEGHSAWCPHSGWSAGNCASVGYLTIL